MVDFDHGADRAAWRIRAMRTALLRS